MTRELRVSIGDSTIEQRIQGRACIFLDMSVWIDLADEKHELARRVRKLLCALAESGRLFCPLSHVTLLELWKQDHESISRAARLMERVSLNLTFARKDEIFTKELQNFIFKFSKAGRKILERSEVLAPVSAYLSSQGKIHFPEGWSEESSNRLVTYLQSRLGSMTVSELVELHKGKTRGAVPEDSQAYYSRAWKERWKVTKGVRGRMRRIEEEKIAQAIIIPRINAMRAVLPTPLQLKFLQWMRSLPKDRYGGVLTSILPELPAIRNEIEMLTVAGLDPNRKPTMNDFLDVEEIAVPLAYAEVFVARDKWIRNLLSRRSGILTWNKCLFIGSLGSFDSFLTELSQSR
jgi:hypothetical protein